MTVRGRVRSNGAQLAHYLMKQADNDNAPVVFDIRGMVFPKDVRKSLLSMSLLSELSKRSNKGLYHVVINPGPHEKPLTPAEWFRSAEILEEETGYQNAERVMVLHTKDRVIHCHLVYSRYDLELQKMRPDSYNKFAQNRARMKMEKEFGHKQLPERNLEEPKLRRLVTKLWYQTANHDAFVQECHNHGYTLAKGTNPPFVIVNAFGRSFDLVRNIKGVKKSDIHALFKGRSMPTDKLAIKNIRQQQKARKKGKTRDEIAEELKQQLTRDAQKSKGRSR
jgi:hypothetical protein